MRNLAKYFGGMVGMLTLVGCALSDDPAAGAEGLQFAVTDTTVEGTFTHEGNIVRFSGVRVENKAVEVEVVLKGMTLSATIEPTGAMDLDAFANENGEGTRMTDEDLVILKALLKAMTEKMDHRSSAMENFLLRAVKLWSNFPGRLELDRLVLAQEGRSYSSLCGYVGQYWYSTHDGPWLVGCDSDNWEDRTSYYGFLSNHADGPCSDGTYFSTNGASWSCYEPDHDSSVEYAYGGCFGQCGGGCGSEDYTVDCANHDSCVRFGHSIAALSCDDEFTFTIDDFGFSPICYPAAGTPNEPASASPAASGSSVCDYKLGCNSYWMGVGDGCDCQADGSSCGDSDCPKPLVCAYKLGCPSYWMGVGDGCDCQADGSSCGDPDCN